MTRAWSRSRGFSRAGCRRSFRTWAEDERGVSDILGNMLLIAITVAIAGGLGALVVKIPGPIDKLHADLLVDVAQGVNGWGNGDEAILVNHRGGEDARAADTTIVVRVNDVLSSYSGSDLGSTFADGRLSIGETWSLSRTLAQGDRVAVDVLVTQRESASLVGTAALTAGQALSGGFTATTYVGTFAATVGSVTDFAFAQSGTDAGAEATFAEAAVTAPILADLSASTATASSANAADVEFPIRATGTPDDQYAIVKKDTHWVRTSGFSAPPSGTITKVEVVFEGRYLGTLVDDRARLSYRVSGAAGATTATFAPNAAADAVTALDVTADRSWTWANVAAMDAQVEYRKTGAQDSGVLLADALWARVTYTLPATYTMAIETSTPSVPLAATHELQVRYRASADTFRAQVWDGSAWNTRGAGLDQTAATSWAYGLTAAEYNGGNVRVRFLDDAPSGGTQGQLRVDHLRVVSTG